jgi:glycosyltransferase involved in cell wall biosynthesis
MTVSAHAPVRVLELRSVRGTGGGPEKTILTGAALAARDGIDVTVCYIRDRRDPVFALDRRAEELGVRYVEVLERHSFDVGIWPQLRRIVADEHVDIIHAHEYKTNLLALLLARRTRTLALSTVHGWTGHTRRERLLYYPVDKRLLSRFQKLVAVSSGIRDELVSHGAPPNRVEVLLNAIDPDAFCRVSPAGTSAREELGFPAGTTIIGSVGRLEPQKRFDLLIEAFTSIRASRPDLGLVIVGDGSLRNVLRRQAEEAGVLPWCRFPGHRDDIAACHQAFDLFVQSSDYEGTPNAVLEAMAMETPIVATDAGGTREIARPDEHALIVPRGSARQLTDAIRAALSDPEGTAVRTAAARLRVERELSFEARTERLNAIYREMVFQLGEPHSTRARPDVVPHA